MKTNYGAVMHIDCSLCCLIMNAERSRAHSDTYSQGSVTVKGRMSFTLKTVSHTHTHVGNYRTFFLCMCVNFRVEHSELRLMVRSRHVTEKAKGKQYWTLCF